jgi:hypothetical protein
MVTGCPLSVIGRRRQVQIFVIRDFCHLLSQTHFELRITAARRLGAWLNGSRSRVFTPFTIHASRINQFPISAARLYAAS